MKIIITSALALLVYTSTSAQQITHNYTALKGTTQIGPGKNDVLPNNEKGYTLILPDSSASTKGIIVSLEDAKFDVEKFPDQQVYKQATPQGFAVIYISTGIPVDLYFSPGSLSYVDSTVRNILAIHQLTDKGIFFLGVNLAGHRALKFIEYAKKKKTVPLNIKGVVLCEGVLDWVRQWYEGKKGIRDNYAESSVFEGKLVTYLLEKNLGGTPKNALEKYLNFSSYSYFDEANRHIKYFKDLAVKAYTEPASHYWIETKRKTTWDTNFPDHVGIINELKLAGNTKAELQVFVQDKKNMDRRNPNYTWGLVDKEELVSWMIKNLNHKAENDN